MMSATVLLNQRGERVVEVSASEAKNSFGRILDSVARTGMVAITRHAQTRAVLLSLEEYRVLTEGNGNVLESLKSEFDAMLDAMNVPGQREAMQRAFDTPPAELGRIAVKGAPPRRA
jgi:antitoxin Phd